MAAAISAFFIGDTLRYCRDARDWPPGPVWVVAADLQRAREPRADRRGGARRRSIGPPRTTRSWSSTTPRPTGRASSPTRSPSAIRTSRSCTGRARRDSGQAYIAGFRRRARRGRALVVEMDADFSHDPRYLPRDAGGGREADVVLGSRYVAGRRVRELGAPAADREQGWMLVRAHGARHRRQRLTGGFKCFRREVLEALDLDGVRSQGYAFQVELTYRALQLGFRVEGDPDRVRRPPRGPEQDVPPDRAGGYVDGPPPCRFGPGAIRNEVTCL